MIRSSQGCPMGTAILLSGFLLMSAVATGSAESPSTDEILKRSGKALAPPVRFRVKLKGIETTISQKVLPGGVLASRTEAVAPSQTILLSLGNDHYEILPQSRVVIDKTRIVIRDGLKGTLRKNELSLSFVPEFPIESQVAGRETASVVRGDKQYYEIKTRLTSPLLKSSKDFPAALTTGIIASKTLLIDKETFVPVEMSDLSPGGGTISKFQFLEIESSPELPDELFALPADFTVKSPVSMKEYTALHEQYWNDIQPPPKFKPKFPRHEDIPDLAFTIDPRTRYLLRPGKTVEQVEADIAAKRVELRRTNPITARPAGRTFILVNFVLLLSVVLIVLVRSHRRSKAVSRNGELS